MAHIYWNFGWDQDTVLTCSIVQMEQKYISLTLQQCTKIIMKSTNIIGLLVIT